MTSNAERSHAGSLALDWNRDDLPALAAVNGWASYFLVSPRSIAASLINCKPGKRNSGRQEPQRHWFSCEPAAEKLQETREGHDAEREWRKFREIGLASRCGVHGAGVTV